MVTVKGDIVNFKFYRPTASAVHIVGDFNGWKQGELLMSRTEDGYWSASIKMQPGVFRFRYWVDGRWFTDFAAFGVEQGPYGLDSIIRVEVQPAITAANGKIRLSVPSPKSQTGMHRAI